MDLLQCQKELRDLRKKILEEGQVENLPYRKIFSIAQKVNAVRRRLRKLIGKNAPHSRPLPLTRDAVQGWLQNPGKYDLSEPMFPGIIKLWNG